MENNIASFASDEQISRARTEFMNKTYAWMVTGLLLTGLTSWYVYESGLFYDIMSSRFSIILLIVAQIGLVMGINSAIERITTATAGLLFAAFSVTIGITFSSIFAVYTAGSIENVFFISAAMFASLSIFGYVTKKDLSAMGSFMFAGLIGIIIASVINIFIASSAIYWITSFAGVIVFAGLTAYDTQKLKDMSIIQLENGELASKIAIIGALRLYLDFINLFMFLLRILGNRR